MSNLSLDEVLDLYHKTKSEAVDKYVSSKQEKYGLEFACDNCSDAWCCCVLLLAHPLEGLLIARELVRKEKFNLIRSANEQGNRQMEVLKSVGYRPDKVEVRELKPALCDWYNRQEPCVFLEDKKCSIYPIRPLSCALLYVAAGYEEKCKRRHKTKDLVPTLNIEDLVNWHLLGANRILSEILGIDKMTEFALLPFGLTIDPNAYAEAEARIG